MTNMTKEELVRKITERDLVLGSLAIEANNSAEDERFYAALSCLFVLMEQVVKLSSGNTEGNLHNQVNLLRKKELLSAEECETLHEIKHIRNKMFHESNYMWPLEANKGITGKAFLFSEIETRKKIWNSFSKKIFKIILNLLNP
jgi:hypothetical protein